MGLILSVYRDAGGMDCTNGGISSKFENVTVVNVEGPFEPMAEPSEGYPKGCIIEARPAVLLESHHAGCLRLVPAEKVNGKWQALKGWAMFGGNYAATSDSRFGEACAKLLGHKFYGAVPMHDRYETVEQARLYSND